MIRRLAILLVPGWLGSCQGLAPHSQAVPASWSAAAEPALEPRAREQISAFLDRLEKEKERFLQEESRQAILNRLDREKVQEAISRRLTEANSLLGREAVRRARAHFEAMDLKSAEFEARKALGFLPESREAVELAGKIKLLEKVQAHRQFGAGACETDSSGPAAADLLAGYLLAAELCLAKGSAAEASSYLLGGLELVQRNREQANRARALERLRQTLITSGPQILQHAGEQDFDPAGEALAGLLGQIQGNDSLSSGRSLLSGAASLNPGALEEIVHAIQAGDFEQAEKLAAREKSPDPSVQLLKKRIQQLKEAVKP